MFQQLTMSRPREHTLLRRIRLLTLILITGLVVSGATAIPLEWELDLLARWLGRTVEQTHRPGWRNGS